MGEWESGGAGEEELGHPYPYKEEDHSLHEGESPRMN
jgi:hypothetical protein